MGCSGEKASGYGSGVRLRAVFSGLCFDRARTAAGKDTDVQLPDPH